ncbi:MAG: hypothetical protein ACXVPN_09640 [Bacteroidia bacterium]
MLNLGKKIAIYILTLLWIVGCNPSRNTEDQFRNASEKTVGTEEYTSIYNQAKDTLDTWVINKLMDVEPETKYPYQLDSLLCFNTDGSRMITCRHLYVNVSGATSDDLEIFYGEKINGKWYFFEANSIVIPRKMAGDFDLTKPLSYQQLHKIALKEVYDGYLNEKGEINEEWFKGHFENVGMCSECKTREDFQKNIVAGSGAIWQTRDTTRPIILLNKKEPLP